MPKQADRTPVEIAQSIVEDPSIDLDSARRFVAAVVERTGSAKSQRPTIVAPSREVEDVSVRVSVWVTDPKFMGTFDRTASTRLVTVVITAKSNAVEKERDSLRSSRLPVREQVGWARAVLGELADYGYRVISDMAQRQVRPAVFAVFVDATGPRLAPSDFKWVLLVGGRRVYAEKLVPESRELLGHLRKHGDMINVDMVIHPWAPAPNVWAMQFASQLNATIADELGRMGRGDSFTFDQVLLQNSSRVVVRYTWHLVDGDKAYGFDIDLAGVRARRLRDFDDPRASTAARSIGHLPFDQPVFRDPEVIDGVTWVRFGPPDVNENA